MNVMSFLRLVIMVLAVCCAGAVLADEGKDESGKGRGRKPETRQRQDRWEERQGWDGGSYFHRHGYARLDIPKGHYPPPGKCRIWYPDRPAGHQPPPGSCGRLRADVPPGAWLIRHPEDDPDHVHVIVYDERRSDSILVIGEFEIGSGMFVRVVVGE